MLEYNLKRPLQFSLLQKSRNFFVSSRLALVLILILGTLCLIGVLLIQSPFAVINDPASYRSWIENVARPKFGNWTDLLSFLRLFDIFHSPWFLAIGSLLMVNILICTINRWKSVKNIIRGGTIKQAPEFYSTGAYKTELLIAEPTVKSGLIMTDILKKHGFRVKSQSSENTINIVADKNRFSPFGTFFTHLSLILFVLGFIVSSFWGFREPSFVVIEGTRKEVGHNTGLFLELKFFEDEYWSDGRPKDYRSQVTLYSEDREIKQAQIRVNSPLRYRGVNFYQSAFGPAVNMQVKAAGRPMLEQYIALTQVIENQGLQRYAGSFSLPATNMTVQLVSSAVNGVDPLISEGGLGLLLYHTETNEPITSEVLETGIPSEINGIEFTYTGEGQYSVFQVTRNPGTALIWIASVLFILGLVMIFYFPFRQTWILIEPKGLKKSRLMMRLTGRSNPTIVKELADLANEIQEKTSINK